VALEDSLTLGYYIYGFQPKEKEIGSFCRNSHPANRQLFPEERRCTDKKISNIEQGTAEYRRQE